MSEKTPMQQTQTQVDFLHWLKCNSEWNARIALRDARDRKAEAAERFAEFAATHHHTDATEEVYEAAERLLREYKAAREAVRKLEEQDKGGKG